MRRELGVVRIRLGWVFELGWASVHLGVGHCDLVNPGSKEHQFSGCGRYRTLSRMYRMPTAPNAERRRQVPTKKLLEWAEFF